MTSSVHVRPAEAADAPAMGHLGALLVTEHHEFDPKRFLAPLPNMTQRYGEFLMSQAEKPQKIVLVAERDGGVVGYAYAGAEGNDYMVLRGPAGEIYDLVVDPAHRRQGIGTLLLEAALGALAKLGAPRAVLFTAERNHVAQQMFAGAGFRRTMIEMTRELNDD
jgi:ribosomal protein S18 acetylase RimI-like enzyme